MGCSSSSEPKGEDELKCEKFRTRVRRSEPLAVALQKSFDDFTRKCANVSGGRSRRVDYDSEVRVNKSVENANDAKLTYEVAKTTASEFLGYAMTQLGERNWGGSIHSHLKGGEGRRSKLQMTGKVEFDTADATVEEEYDVEFEFFCALEN